MLLDTSVLQNLRVVMDVIADGEGFAEGYLTDGDAENLLRRYPLPLGPELVALGDLMMVLERNGPPWVVSEASLIEFEPLHGTKGKQLRQWWSEWADYFDACLDGGWYPGLDVESLLIRQVPLVAQGQLSLEVEPQRPPLSAECVPAFGPFRDAGDRALIRTALRAGIPTILTTDLNSFWRHRHSLYPLGLEVWRPTDLWKTLQRKAA